jgi:hypothetical protein
MYTNIPTHEIPRLISQICDHQKTPKPIKRELTSLTKTILKHNYFGFKIKFIHKPKD